MHTSVSHAHADIGTVKVPVGIAGPLRVRGTFISGMYSIYSPNSLLMSLTGEFYVPLATTEAALVVRVLAVVYNSENWTEIYQTGVGEQRCARNCASWGRHHNVRAFISVFVFMCLFVLIIFNFSFLLLFIIYYSVNTDGECAWCMHRFVDEGVSRVPVFQVSSLTALQFFAKWYAEHWCYYCCCC